MGWEVTFASNSFRRLHSGAVEQCSTIVGAKVYHLNCVTYKKILLLCHDVNLQEEVRLDGNHLVCLKFYSPRCITYLSQNTLAYCITSSGVFPSTSLLIDSRSSLPYFSLAFINWLKSRLFHVVNPCNQDKHSVYCIVFYCIAMQFLTLLH